MGFRDTLEKLSSKLSKSRATSPAPPASSQELNNDIQQPSRVNPVSPQAPKTLPKELWNKAYDELKDSETSKNIVKAYEDILSSQLQKAAASPDNNADVANIVASDHQERWQQMKSLVQSGFERTARDADRKQKVNQWLEMIKPLRQAIDTGIKAAPEAAVPWAGVCCALEILSSPLTEPKKNRDGMTYVLTRMEWYWALSQLLLDKNRSRESSLQLRAQLEAHVISLYGKLLLYEMKSVILYHRSGFGVFMRDLPKLDDWETQVKEIKDAEASIERDSRQYNSQEIISTLKDIRDSAVASETKLQEILLENKEHHAWQRQDRLEEKDRECLQVLYMTNPRHDKEAIIGAKGRLLPKSYEWVIENESYQQWLKDDDDRLLWIKGDPGKGKTMLLCGIIEELEKSAPSSVFFFFCQAAIPQLRTAAAVLRGLIWFLADTRPNLIPYIQKEYDHGGKDVFSNHNHLQALSSIITAMLQDETTNNYVFVVDALDECTEGRDWLIALISQLSTSYKSKWIVSSRNWPEIEAQLNPATNDVRPHSLHLELNHTAIKNAVQNFIARKVEGLAKDKNYQESTRTEVLNHLLSNANDTFLWVSLVCEQLGKANVLPHHVPRILKSFPAGLKGLYERMMTVVLDSMDRDVCKAILAVVTVAFEPLTLAELAVSDERITRFMTVTGPDPYFETLASIVNSCGSFLAIRNSTVYAVHQSANDFLQTVSDIFPLGIAEQHYSIFLSSMNGMQALHRNLYQVHDTTIYIDEISKPPSNKLDAMRYGCIYWIDHLCESTREAIQRPSTCKQVKDLLKRRYLYWLEAMSLLRCVSKAIKSIRKLESGLQHTATKELQSLVEDALRFALTHRAILDHVPLQLYDSALIFSPARSQVRQNFENEISTDIGVLPSSFQDWDACLFTIPGLSTSYKTAFCFSPDGGRLATTQEDSLTVLILDTFTGEIMRKLKAEEGKMSPFALGAEWELVGAETTPIAFSPEGQHLVTMSRFPSCVNTIMIWDTYTCDCVQSFQSNLDHGDLAALSRDGKFLALSDKYGVIDVWDPWAAHCRYTLDQRQGEGEIRWINFGLCAADSHSFISIVRRKLSFTVVVQDLETGNVKATASSDGTAFCEAALDPDFKRLVITFYDGIVLLWDLQTSTGLQEIDIGDEGPFPIFNITWAPDGQSFAIATTNGVILWDLTKKAQIAHIPSGPGERVRYGSATSLVSLRSGSLKMWRVGSGSIETNSVDQQISNPIFTIVSGLQENIGIRRANGDATILSTATGNALCKFHDPSPFGRFAGVFGPRHKFAFVDENGLINIFDTKTGDCLHKLRSGVDDDGLSAVAIEFDTSGQLVSHNEQEKRVQIWDSDTGRCSRTFTTRYHDDNPIISPSVDGRVAIAFDNEEFRSNVIIEIWDLNRGELERTLDDTFLVDTEGLSFSSDGLLAVLSERYDKERVLSILNVGGSAWVEKYILSPVQYARFDTKSNSRIDVGHGVIDVNLRKAGEVGGQVEKKSWEKRIGIPPVWNQQFLRIVYTDAEAWLMKGPKRVLWIPRSMVTKDTFVVMPNFDTGASVVAVAHGSHVLILRFGETGMISD